MKYDYDVVCIGLGPAGMAVSVMASEMGLKVCAIEKDKVGGECMNVGCIPSKSILRIAKYRHAVKNLNRMGLSDSDLSTLKAPFDKIQEYLSFISEKKTMKMFDKVDLILNEGSASFSDPHTVRIAGRTVTGRKIFIATGTEPKMLPIPGIDEVDILTNKNIFTLENVPGSMTVIGGGAIGCELAQAFTRLGTKCSIVQMDGYLVPEGDPQAGELLESVFKEEGIDVYNSRSITKIERNGENINLHTEDGLCLTSEKLMLAAGRDVVLDGLKLENAGVEYGKKGINVDAKLRTNVKHIYAVGDCNGGLMLSHAAMHQGMFAIMNTVSPLYKFKYGKYVIPWTVFTDPQVSYVGMKAKDLKARGINYKTYTVNYRDYGAAIAESVETGFVKVFTNSLGKVYGVSIVGEGSGEMINEWALAIQKKIRLHDIMFLAHSFPSMGFLSKRVAETWMMDKMKSGFIRRMCRFLFKMT